MNLVLPYLITQVSGHNYVNTVYVIVNHIIYAMTFNYYYVFQYTCTLLIECALSKYRGS